jgi:hypothetical protein
MTFNDHSRLKDQHAFLGASKYHWINYDEEKLAASYTNFLAVQRGTKLHDFARQCIELGVKLPRSQKTLNMYVNDAIGFKMAAEQVLYYSENCFGTVDSIIFKNNTLRIHDLKTGATPASMNQLFVYESLFCLEYGIKPGDIETELRIYQSDNVMSCSPDPDKILKIMDKIITFDKLINELKMGG